MRMRLILAAVALVCALGVVTAQHQARKLYIELQQERDRAKQYEVEWGRLQLEQSTWAMHSRIERIATQQLKMQVPESDRIQRVVSP